MENLREKFSAVSSVWNVFRAEVEKLIRLQGFLWHSDKSWAEINIHLLAGSRYFCSKEYKLWQYILSLITISAHVPLTAAEKYGEKTVAYGWRWTNIKSLQFL